MTNETVQILQRVSLFAGLPGPALARVARVAIRRSYASGEIIILEGDPCEAVYFIAAGQVRVYRLSLSGRQQVLARLGPGQAFNTVPPFQPRPLNHATVEALAPVTLYAVPRDEFRQLVHECPELALALLQDFADRLDHLTRLVEDLSLRTVRALDAGRDRRSSGDGTGYGRAHVARFRRRQPDKDEAPAHHAARSRGVGGRGTALIESDFCRRQTAASLLSWSKVRWSF